LDWFLYQAGMLTFRAFAQGRATWILNYSWDGDKGVDARDAMKNLAMSVVMAGANFWDAAGHHMAGSNDPSTRKQIFDWIAKNEKSLYLPRVPMHPVGVYFSPKSRDYHADAFLSAYRGTLLLLLQTHREFQVVTPRTLADFRGEALVLPDVTELGIPEQRALRNYLENGGRVVSVGKNPKVSCAGERVTCFATSPPSQFYEGLQREFVSGALQLPQEFLRSVAVKSEMEVEAPPTIAANFGLVGGVPHVFLANFGGLVPSKAAVPAPAKGVRVRIAAAKGDTLTYLPFLGEARPLHGERKKDDKVEFVLPPVERGAVVWIGRAN
jgi:hypothetical protein